MRIGEYPSSGKEDPYVVGSLAQADLLHLAIKNFIDFPLAKPQCIGIINDKRVPVGMGFGNKHVGDPVNLVMPGFQIGHHYFLVFKNGYLLAYKFKRR